MKHRPARPRAASGEDDPLSGLVDLDDDRWTVALDDDTGAAVTPVTPRGRPAGPRGRRRLLLAAGAAAVVVLVALSLVRHEQQREQLLAAELQAQRLSAWQAQQRAAADHDRRQVDALALLPEDLAFQQRLMASALAGAAPRLPDLDWSTATTRTERTTAQRLGDGSPRLLDAQRTARPVQDDGTGDDPGTAVPVAAAAGTQVVGLALGSAPTSSVTWRITTPLSTPEVTDPCAVPGAVTVPGGPDAPVCRVRTTTSPSGEQHAVALRTWQLLLGSPGDAAPVREVTVNQAVLLVEQRWTFSVAATAVGTHGTAASVPLLSADQADLAVRWAADLARGLPTPAPLRGTPLTGFDG
ncbi:hypothetical protein FHN55_04925 [Streptomyces sp. NP160]|uniref:hypothetical protein n=1 Tax=Streptomyces sp. NP160 TaxID=2586637 RepID=UPI00111AAB03|nr:hypothetical protein [Streptomyces sp. NP160]TNM69132.1 hypothetical protein FHN55_04925 [Streptomyces sp. NP160]